MNDEIVFHWVGILCMFLFKLSMSIILIAMASVVPVTAVIMLTELFDKKS